MEYTNHILDKIRSRDSEVGSYVYIAIDYTDILLFKSLIVLNFLRIFYDSLETRSYRQYVISKLDTVLKLIFVKPKTIKCYFMLNEIVTLLKYRSHSHCLSA